MGPILYSVVIPVYNEEAAITSTIKRIEDYFNKRRSTYEVILVNDGSTDATVTKIRNEISDRPNVRLLANRRNEGKGAAVRKGMLSSRGDYLIFTDADMSTPIEELDSILEPGFAYNDKIVIGIRDETVKNKKVDRPAIRKIVSRTYNFMANFLFGLKMNDIGCGFKCFPSAIAKSIFAEQKIKGWVFDAELLLKARKMGVPVKEVPVSWANHLITRVNIIPDSAYCAFDLLRLFYYNLAGKL
ncbi:MAG: dolichyl-phosphate beta-glucosyltransferase [Candidatus Omnitrophota bacterium]